MNRNDRAVVGLAMTAHALVHTYELSVPILVGVWLERFDTLDLVAVELTVTPAVLGAVVSVGYGLFGLGALPGGVLADVFGSRRLIAACLAGMAGSFLLLSVAPSVLVVAVALALWGVAASVYHPSGLSLISTGVVDRGTGFAYHGVAGNVGIAGGPLATALLLVPFGWRTVVAVLAAPAALAAVAAVRIDVDETAAVDDAADPATGTADGATTADPADPSVDRVGDPSGDPGDRSASATRRDGGAGDAGADGGTDEAGAGAEDERGDEPGDGEAGDGRAEAVTSWAAFRSGTRRLFAGSFLLVFVVVVASGLYYRGVLTFLPEVLSGFRGFDPVRVGTLELEPARYAYAGLLAVGVGGQYVGGKLTDRIDPARGLAGGFGALAVLAVLFVPVATTGLAGFLVVGTLLGVALFTVQPMYQATVAELTPAGTRGLSYGYTYLGVFGVGALGGAVAGGLLTYGSPLLLFAVLAGIAAVAAVVGVVLSRR